MGYAYKMFRVAKSAPGKIFPLFVDAANETPVGEWVAAKAGEILESGKVKSRIGPLAFRPGWHLSDIPLAVHIGVKDESGNIVSMNKEHVWCLCEYADAVDYQPQANKNGTRNGKIVPKHAYIKQVPENGCYRYKTNPNMLGEWIISGSIKVLRILGDDEVENILKEQGYDPMPRDGGALDLRVYGFNYDAAKGWVG